MRKTASRIVYENRWMTVREDEIERADGLVIPFDGAGFYLVEQHRYAVGARFHEFPQGSWEAYPDADPLALARGELKEETGLQADSMEHLGHLYEAYGFSTQGFDVYLATELSQGTPAPTIEEENLRVEHVTVPDFEQLVRDGHIKDAPAWRLTASCNCVRSPSEKAPGQTSGIGAALPDSSQTSTRRDLAACSPLTPDTIRDHG